MKSKIIFYCLVLFALVLPAFGQTNAQIENELTKLAKETEKYSTYSGNYDEEKLAAANKTFEEKLLKYTTNRATLKYNFSKLGEIVGIATSDDGKFRAYSWDLGTGGTMHDYAVVYQYETANGKVNSHTDKKEEGNFGSFVYAIYSTDTKTGKVYAVCTTFIGSTSDHYGAVNLYKIRTNKLIDNVKLFKTKSGVTDSISFEYDFFSVADRPERPLQLIRFDKASQTIKIPVVIQDEKSQLGRVTSKFINYKYDGNYFVRMN